MLPAFNQNVSRVVSLFAKVGSVVVRRMAS
jgi:hypothetical protein